jgi:hypothetical protein
MNFKKFFFIPTLVLTATIIFTSCETEEPLPTPKAKVNFELTDAPADDANITAVFVTVASVDVDGEPISDFVGKQTIDLLSFQNGNTKALGSGQLEIGDYDRISLTLDFDADADGNSPGCYVLTDDNVKHPLTSTGEQALNLSGLSFSAIEGQEKTMVMDFDVRKAVKYQDSGDDTDQYDFVTTSEMESSIRVVDKSRTLSISGQIDNPLGTGGDYVVAYVYEKGDFNEETETNPQGASGIEFKNAITSALVDASGNYELSFLEAGEYELYFVTYEAEPTGEEPDRRTASGFLQVNSLTSLNLLGLELEAGVDITINVIVTGFNPF